MSLLNPGAIAKRITGKVSNFREVLSFNPGSLPFALPPQVALGLKVANSLGLKVPTESQVTQLVTGQLDFVLKGARREVTEALAAVQTKLLPEQLRNLKPEEVLQRIEWLQ